jgi:ribosomal protein S17E
MWTKLDTDAYSSNDQNQKARTGTVAQGMEKTGGYIGTDLDNNEQKKH